MKAHTKDFKEGIKKFGRQLESKITYTIGGTTTELGNEQLNSVSPHYEGSILKSTMRQLDIDSNVEIPIGTEVNYKFGLKLRSGNNLYNYKDTVSVTSGVFVDSDGWITASFDNTSGTANKYMNYWTHNLALTASTNYRIITEIKSVSGSGSLIVVSNPNATSGQFEGTVGYSFGSLTNNVVKAETKTTKASLTNVNYGIRSYIQFQAGQSGSITFRISVLSDTTITPSKFVYEGYGSVDYIDYGTYIVKDVEKQEDTRSYKITCYDKMLNAMKDYENSGITYPITVRNYINAICNKLGITFKNANTTFANYNRTIPSELYLDADGRSLGYTFRDVLDELAEVTASTICINEEDNELEIRYPSVAVGKNLFNLDEFLRTATKGNCTTTKITNGFTMNFTAGVDAIVGATLNQGGTLPEAYRNAVAKVKPNTTYTMHLNNSPKCYIDFLNSSYVATQNYYKFAINYTGPTNYTFRTDANTTYLYFRFGIQNNNYTSWTFENIQLEEGYDATDYEPYGDTIDEDYLKDINVKFADKIGPINTIILSRSDGADKLSLSEPTNLSDEDKISIEIADNQIMNDNNRADYMADILSKLYGLEYYINDYASTGICYYNLCDKYNIKIGSTYYNCIMFNDEVNVTQGLAENVFTPLREENETNYKYTSDDDRKATQAYLIAKKAEGIIVEYTGRLDADEGRLNAVETWQDDTTRAINVMSTHIDSNGNVTEVTTTTGFTFNADGMTISDSNTDFSALHRNDGTYYYDGSTIVGQYTKDGSKQKDLELFGVYYYGKNNLPDTPMFVAQLYTDNNGEEGFGHFYNRGD